MIGISLNWREHQQNLRIFHPPGNSSSHMVSNLVTFGTEFFSDQNKQAICKVNFLKKKICKVKSLNKNKSNKCICVFKILALKAQEYGVNM